MKEEEAKMLASFLIPMLKYYPEKRISAHDALLHPWLQMPATANYKMTEEEIRKRAQLKERYQDLANTSLDDADSEVCEGDREDNSSFVDSNLSFSEHDNYFLHTSFQKGGYVPYGGGINMEDMDQDPNWQFIDAEKTIYEEDKEFTKNK